jgi:hypothetical protein
MSAFHRDGAWKWSVNDEYFHDKESAIAVRARRQKGRETGDWFDGGTHLCGRAAPTGDELDDFARQSGFFMPCSTKANRPSD